MIFTVIAWKIHEKISLTSTICFWGKLQVCAYCKGWYDGKTPTGNLVSKLCITESELFFMKYVNHLLSILREIWSTQ